MSVSPLSSHQTLLMYSLKEDNAKKEKAFMEKRSYPELREMSVTERHKFLSYSGKLNNLQSNIRFNEELKAKLRSVSVNIEQILSNLHDMKKAFTEGSVQSSDYWTHILNASKRAVVGISDVLKTMHDEPIDLGSVSPPQYGGQINLKQTCNTYFVDGDIGYWLDQNYTIKDSLKKIKSNLEDLNLNYMNDRNAETPRHNILGQNITSIIKDFENNVQLRHSSDLKSVGSAITKLDRDIKMYTKLLEISKSCPEEKDNQYMDSIDKLNTFMQLCGEKMQWTKTLEKMLFKPS